MASCEMLRSVALVRTDVSEELSTSIIRVTRIGELGTTLVDSSPILVTLMKEALSSSETSAITRATRRSTPEDTILHSHRREKFKSYIRPTARREDVDSTVSRLYSETVPILTLSSIE
jgi:hypothetical protein